MSDTTLINFLRDTADSIENNKISEADIGKVKEFYLSHAIEKLINEDESPQEVETKDFLKFLFMGYYMYKMVNQSVQN